MCESILSNEYLQIIFHFNLWKKLSWSDFFFKWNCWKEIHNNASSMTSVLSFFLIHYNKYFPFLNQCKFVLDIRKKYHWQSIKNYYRIYPYTKRDLSIHGKVARRQPKIVHSGPSIPLLFFLGSPRFLSIWLLNTSRTWKSCDPCICIIFGWILVLTCVV